MPLENRFVTSRLEAVVRLRSRCPAGTRSDSRNCQVRKEFARSLMFSSDGGEPSTGEFT